MTKYGSCSTCNRTFTVEDRVVGKVIGMALAGLVTAFAGKDASKNPLLFAGLNVAGLAIGHAIDSDLGMRCRTPGCATILKIVNAALV